MRDFRRRFAKRGPEDDANANLKHAPAKAREAVRRCSELYARWREGWVQKDDYAVNERSQTHCVIFRAHKEGPAVLVAARRLSDVVMKITHQYSHPALVVLFQLLFEFLLLSFHELGREGDLQEENVLVIRWKQLRDPALQATTAQGTYGPNSLEALNRAAPAEPMAAWRRLRIPEEAKADGAGVILDVCATGRGCHRGPASAS